MNENVSTVIEKDRLDGFDFVRGVAAVIVVMCHLRSVFVSHHNWVDITPVRVLFSGVEPVVFFLYLAGFLYIKV